MWPKRKIIVRSLHLVFDAVSLSTMIGQGHRSKLADKEREVFIARTGINRERTPGVIVEPQGPKIA